MTVVKSLIETIIVKKFVITFPNHDSLETLSLQIKLRIKK